MAEIAKIEAIQLTGFREPNWYARVTYEDGRTWHSEPWLTEEAAQYHVAAMQTVVSDRQYRIKHHLALPMGYIVHPAGWTQAH